MDKVLTKTFEFVSYPKPIRPKKSKKPRKGRSTLKKRHSRTRLPSIKSLKAKADSLFSKFIIARDKRCVLCGSTYKLTNGHLIKRGNMPTRYDEVNCHCLCSKCNFKDWKVRSYHDFYVAWFIKEYDPIQYNDLVDSIRIKQMKRIDYLKIIKKYEKI